MPQTAADAAFRSLLTGVLRKVRVQATGLGLQRNWGAVRRIATARVHDLCARVWLHEREVGFGRIDTGAAELASDVAGGAHGVSSDFAPWAPLLPELAATLAGQVAAQLGRLLAASRQLAPAGAWPDLVRWQGPCSDFHSGGACVWRCVFAGRGTWFYKPRPVEIDVAFADLVERLRVREAAPLAPPPALVPMRDSGWQAAARAATPRGRRQAVRACLGLGWLLAILQALRATDIHPDNVIFAAEGPVLVDAETILHPGGPACALEYVGAGLRVSWHDSLQRLNAFSAHLAGDTTGRTTRLGWFEAREFLGTVSRPRLHPDGAGGLSADAGTTWVPNPHARFWQAVRRLHPAWREDVWRGFVDGWSALQADGAGFEAAVQRCQAAPRRVIWRDTAAFYQLLARSLTGSALRSWEARRNFFARAFGPAGAPPLTEGEIADLVQGDIPRVSQTESVPPADLTRPADSFREEFTLCLREGGSEVRLIY